MSRPGRIATLACFLGVGSAALALELVKDGKATATLVLPEPADEQVRKAAGWLQEYVKKATGADLPLASEREQRLGPQIVLGPSKAAAAAGVSANGLKWDGCRLVVKGQRLFLLGRDTPGVAGRTHLGAKGTARAAVVFLERFLGVRWLVPSPQGEVVPKTASLSVPDDLNVESTPAFAYGHGRYLYGVGTPASFANNFRTAVRIYTAGGHTWNVWVPYATYKDTHPEYFALIGGKRSPSERNHLCATSEEVKQLLLKGLTERFAEGYEWAQLGQSDGYQPCRCPACEALDSYTAGSPGKPRRWEFGHASDPDHPCERILVPHKWLIDECAKRYPDRTVHLLVYGPTTWPSKKFDRFGDNVVAEVCGPTPEKLAAWKDKVRAMTTYVYYWGTYHPAGIGPKFSPRQVADELRMLHEHNVIGIYYCGGGEDWGLEGPAYYAAGRLMGDPSLDPDALVTEYCAGLYGEAAPTMLRFFNLLYSVLEQEVPRLPGCSRAETEFATRYPPAVLARLESLLRAAEAQATTERAKGWLRLTRDAFDYLAINARMYIFYRAYMAKPSVEALLRVKAEVDAWKAWREKALNYDKARARVWYPGLDTVVAFIREGGHMHSRTGPPADWDFDTMLRGLQQQKKGPVRIEASRAPAAPQMDGRLEDLWKAAAPQPLAPLSGAPAAVGATVRLLYDDQTLYVAFECVEPAVEKMRTDPKGHDADIWNLECVEVFLDPAGRRTQYIHFIVGAAPDARYDARKGYDPATEAEDKAWNTKWTSAIHIAKDAQRWTAELAIPFASLGVAAPKPGSVWAGNFGRERYAGNRNPHLYLWSPNDLGTGFCEPLCFGEIRFGPAAP
ncbi:MAG TPA: DUF4838 domain-containing protein [Planctomycetota bacterium]|nr:DUF4838 domain-containing protein [Planctomycetota bacterium]